MQFYPTKLRLSILGSDRNADGVLVIQLPCPPSVGLYLADIYTRGNLYIDQPIMSPLSHEWTAYCSVIDGEGMTCEEIIRCFVGDWEWTVMPIRLPDDDSEDDTGDEDGDPSDPESDPLNAEREAAEEEKYRRAIERLTRGRNENKENIQ